MRQKAFVEHTNEVVVDKTFKLTLPTDGPFTEKPKWEVKLPKNYAAFIYEYEAVRDSWRGDAEHRPMVNEWRVIICKNGDLGRRWDGRRPGYRDELSGDWSTQSPITLQRHLHQVSRALATMKKRQETVETEYDED